MKQEEDTVQREPENTKQEEDTVQREPDNFEIGRRQIPVRNRKLRNRKKTQYSENQKTVKQEDDKVQREPENMK